MQVDPPPPSPASAADCSYMFALISPKTKKRARSPVHIKVQELQREAGDDPDLDYDNIRVHKRYLSEVIAADLGKLNMEWRKPSRPPSQYANLKVNSFMNECSQEQAVCQSAIDEPSCMDSMDCSEHSSVAKPAFGHSQNQQQASDLSMCPVPDQMPPFACSSIANSALNALSLGNHDSPSSPSDTRAGLDLRKTALIRSLLMRSSTQHGTSLFSSTTPMPPQQMDSSTNLQAAGPQHSNISPVFTPPQTHPVISLQSDMQLSPASHDHTRYNQQGILDAMNLFAPCPQGAHNMHSSTVVSVTAAAGGKRQRRLSSPV